MLQSFDDIADPSVGRPRVAALRSELARAGLDGFIVPRADEHQGEYVPDRAARLRWLTGFAGSAGTAAGAATSAIRWAVEWPCTSRWPNPTWSRPWC